MMTIVDRNSIIDCINKLYATEHPVFGSLTSWDNLTNKNGLYSIISISPIILNNFGCYKDMKYHAQCFRINSFF